MNHTCVTVISSYSTLKKKWKLDPNVILIDCKDIKKKVIKQNNDNFSSSDESDDSDEE